MTAVKAPLPQMRHLNGDLLVSVSATITGLDPEWSDMVQIAIIVADDWMEIEKSVTPFFVTMAPTLPDLLRIENLTPKRLTKKQIEAGEDFYTCAEIFLEWFDKIGLKRGKMFQPIGYEWHKIYPFIIKWLGRDAAETVFRPWVRDIQSLTLSMNDRAHCTFSEYPAPKRELASMWARFGVVNEFSGDCLHDALSNLELYRRLVGKYV